MLCTGYGWWMGSSTSRRLASVYLAGVAWPTRTGLRSVGHLRWAERTVCGYGRNVGAKDFASGYAAWNADAVADEALEAVEAGRQKRRMSALLHKDAKLLKKWKTNWY